MRESLLSPLDHYEAADGSCLLATSRDAFKTYYLGHLTSPLQEAVSKCVESEARVISGDY